MINDATRLNTEEGQDDRLLKPLGGYLGYSSEWRELAQVISRVRAMHASSIDLSCRVALVIMHLIALTRTSSRVTLM